MFEQYKNEQPILYKLMNKIMNNPNKNHAYLFQTNDVYYAKEIIYSFAKSLLCPNHGCNECSVCNRIDHNTYPEMLVIERSGAMIKKEQIQRLKENFSKKSMEGNTRLYIIFEVDKLNKESANSLLKFLEEPEENVIGILTTNSLSKVQDTIVSRCQIIPLKPVVREEGGTSFEMIRQLFSLDDKTLGMLNGEKGKEKIDKIIQFLMILDQEKTKTIVKGKKLWHNEFETKETVIMALQIMVLFYRELLEYKLSSRIKLFEDYKEEIKKLSKQNEVVEIIRKIDIILQTKEKANTNFNLNLLFDKMVIEIGGK